MNSIEGFKKKLKKSEPEKVYTTSNLIESFTPLKATAKPQRRGKRTSSPDEPTKSKIPQPDQNVEQRIATAGETVPIVFGKRTNSKGGIWVQPSLVRAGSNFFKGSFLFPISQGQIASSPLKYRIFIGLRNLAFFADSTITATAIYNSAATLAASPGTCPILGDGLFCGNETYTFLGEVFTPTGETIGRLDFIGSSYKQFRLISRGSGDTTNTSIMSTYRVFDNISGAELTSAFFSAIGLPSNAQVLVSAAASATISGAPIGVVQDYIAFEGYDAPDSFFGIVWSSIGSSGSITEKWTNVGIDNQINPSFPATTGTLDATQYEWVVSKYANPNSTPTADNSAFADITFLKIVGDIYDPPAAGSYPTTTSQVSIYYEQGVIVSLYSVGLVSGVYTQGASNQLVDLAMYLFNIYKRSSTTDPDVAAPVFTGNMQDLAAFCDEYDLYYNGIISESLNIIEYLGEVSPYFLLSFLSNGGQYRFEPVLPLNGSQQIQTTALTPAATFTEDEILPGSFSKTYVPAADKTDVNVNVLYRLNSPDAIGTQQTVQVRYSGVGLDAPLEQFDMSDFCTDRNHAVIYAKHFLARRKYSVHSISFSTPLSTAGLIPTDVIKLERQRITSTGDNRTEIEWYQITSISHSTEGVTSIEAAQFPVNGSNVARISNDVINGSFTIV